jgi:hypothetical protein
MYNTFVFSSTYLIVYAFLCPTFCNNYQTFPIIAQNTFLCIKWKRSRDFSRSKNDTVWDNFRFFLPAAKFDGFGLVRTRRHAKKAEALLEIPEPRREKFEFQRKKSTLDPFLWSFPAQKYSFILSLYLFAIIKHKNFGKRRKNSNQNFESIACCSRNIKKKFVSFDWPWKLIFHISRRLELEKEYLYNSYISKQKR